MNESDYLYMTILEATNIPANGGFYNLYKNRWWGISKDKKLVFFQSYTSPQCNINMKIVERLMAFENSPIVELMFFENVFVPLNIYDYI